MIVKDEITVNIKFKNMTPNLETFKIIGFSGRIHNRCEIIQATKPRLISYFCNYEEQEHWDIQQYN